MKKFLYLSSITMLSLSLIGCSNTTEKTNSSTSSTSEQVKKTEDFLFSHSKEIQKIELTKAEGNKTSKAETDNEELIKEFNEMIRNAKYNKIDLKKQKENTSVYSNMTVTFKDDSQKEFLVWNENDNQILITKNTNEESTQGIKLSLKTSKIVTNFFKNS
ncbi:hypothetical protein [Bacillus pseudomycoides]|uniref:hypothetical protein n=1 Tax=Bacillus pseudomycoides TaxID=64104 RepID=UPI000BED6023|nr:hypothetical protein [Bacillus pseudomycoides]PED08582.1 hypothetical protein COO19_09200 [Bacillus pseudomycoides]PEI96784.1 hypothetical protein CN686_11660 [Bacillus pseudomycoides]PEK28546.1 hypothetical protein CN693_05790 [Bacillus pseudomycoides]PEM68426.1 hypothetical protein CN619_23780 [Bacillus pseudomycoides]PEO23867.1 hypothetical protein CN542_00055 [Bacillus pseudomycoides]